MLQAGFINSNIQKVSNMPSKKKIIFEKYLKV